MGIAASEDELHDAALLASESVVVRRAVKLARWIGTRRLSVTPRRVLRKVDVPGAGAALGVDVPSRLRTMADLPALHRPWCVAVATGLLRIGDGWVTGGPALERWPPGEAEVLAGWLAGLRAVCAAESRPWDEDSVLLHVIALLTVLGKGGVPRARGLWEPVRTTLYDLCDRYDKSYCDLRVERYFDPPVTGTPVAGLLALLDEFGAVAGDVGKPVISPLGRWAAGNLAVGLPGLADPGLSAAEMIAEAARFSDETQQGHVARGWLAGREPAEAAREILTAADGMSPLLRNVAVAAVERLGEEALPAWRDMAGARCVGPFARAVLSSWEQGPEPSDADWRWLAVEAAAVALDDKGPDAALSSVWESTSGADLDARLAVIRATCHPDAEALAGAVAEFASSGAQRSIDQVADLKVSLANFRPPIWRRVQLPVTASLGDLHEVIQLLFGWDGDHLYLFRAGKKEYGNPFAGLERMQDDQTIRIQDAMVLGDGALTYTYDFGAWWEHEVTLKRTLARDRGQNYPVCVAYEGDSPVEYWSDDDPVECEPFDQAEVNRKLAAFTSLGRQ